MLSSTAPGRCFQWSRGRRLRQHKQLAIHTSASVSLILFLTTAHALCSVLNGPSNSSKGWPPFMGDEGKALLGELDLAFLGTYAACLIFSGHIADQVNLKWFLTAGRLQVPSPNSRKLV